MPKAIITGKVSFPEYRNIFQQLEETLSTLGVSYQTVSFEDPITEAFDIVFCVGGDGNFIAAARKFVSFKKPVIGINAGTLGFLPNIYPHEIEEKVPLLFQENIHWTKRLMVTGRHNDTEICALNEFLFSDMRKGILSQFTLYINHQKAMSVRADGLMIATATGSTAYNLSAGGSIALPDMNILLITPVCPHVLGERPLIVGLNNHIEIVNSNNIESNIWADGQEAITFLPNERFTISQPKYLKSHPIDSKEFFKTLALKLGWNTKNIT